jgi:hypothetical protein
MFQRRPVVASMLDGMLPFDAAAACRIFAPAAGATPLPAI